MSFNITVVAFDKEPDLSEEKILAYRGFDLALVGKATSGQMYEYSVRTSITGTYIKHVQVRDEQVDSRNVVLVFENAFQEGAVSEDDIPVTLRERTQQALAETMLRLKCADIDRLEGPYFAEGVMAFCFLDARDAIADDLVEANRSLIAAIKNK
ncbi:hypothetical protein D3C85_15320 [compost metagenome]